MFPNQSANTNPTSGNSSQSADDSKPGGCAAILVMIGGIFGGAFKHGGDDLAKLVARNADDLPRLTGQMALNEGSNAASHFRPFAQRTAEHAPATALDNAGRALDLVDKGVQLGSLLSSDEESSANPNARSSNRDAAVQLMRTIAKSIRPKDSGPETLPSNPKSELKQIGRTMGSLSVQKPLLPRKGVDLEPFCSKQLWEKYDFAWMNITPSDSKNGKMTMLAWERNGDASGHRYVLLSDYSTIKKVSQQEFAALQTLTTWSSNQTNGPIQ